MHGSGTREHGEASGLNAVIVATQWYAELMEGLIAGANEALADAGARDVPVVRAPGSFELPIIAQAHARAGADAIIALGVIIRGQTPHFDYIASATTDGLQRVSLDTRTPIGFGVLTCDNEEQARGRAGLRVSRANKGREAADAALASVAAIGAVRQPPGHTV